MALPDNRIKLPAPEIDFTNDVGITGQDHDLYPAPDTQARFDWLRLYLIGLLACQSSHGVEPSNYRAGTLWYDIDEAAYQHFDGSDWEDLAKAITVPTADTASTEMSLYDWAGIISSRIDSFHHTAVFSGVANADASVINIPTSAQEIAGEDGMHPFLYKNGLLIDPRLTNFNTGCPTCVELTGAAALEESDTFTVIIQHVNVMVSETVTVN